MLKLTFVLLLSIVAVLAQGPRITTSQYNNFRSGANLQERVLKPRNVNASQFGKVFSSFAAISICVIAATSIWMATRRIARMDVAEVLRAE